MTTVGELMNRLKDRPSDMPIAYMIWGPEDIKYQASQDKVELTDEQVESILEGLHLEADASTGITWNTVSHQIAEELCPF